MNSGFLKRYVLDYHAAIIIINKLTTRTNSYRKSIVPPLPKPFLFQSKKKKNKRVFLSLNTE